MFGHDFAGYGPHVVEICVPEFEHRLPFEPPQAHEQAVDDARLVILTARFFGGEDDLFRDDGAVGFCDLPFLQLAGDDLFDLVFEAEGDAGDVFGGHGGFDAVIGVGG